MYPPAAATNRHNATKVQLGDVLVPKDSNILVAIYAVHHDAEVWPQAEAFRPERFLPGHEELAARAPHAHIPFGGGSRMCIGYKFAIQVRPGAAWRDTKRFRSMTK